MGDADVFLLYRGEVLALSDLIKLSRGGDIEFGDQTNIPRFGDDVAQPPIVAAILISQMQLHRETWLGRC